MDDQEIDEVALNALLAEGLDVPTAVAGSIKPKPGPLKPQAPLPRWAWYLIWIVGAALGIGFGLLFR